jgi:hypothetical protein
VKNVGDEVMRVDSSEHVLRRKKARNLG